MNVKQAVCTLALCGIAGMTNAANLGFLGDSILAELDQTDIAAFKATIRGSLDAVDDKESITWQSDKNDITILITPQLSYQQGDSNCKRTEFKLSQPGHSNERYLFEICKVDQGWEVSPSPIKSFSKADLNSFTEQFYQVLDTGAYGVPSTWINPKSKNSAVIVPLEEIGTSTSRCRQASVTVIDNKGRTADGSYIFCQGADGSWRRP